MILVAGSTGMVGGEVCRLLSGQKMPFRALVRTVSDPAKVENLKGLGAEIVTGDLREPETLRSACEGIETVICTPSSMPFSYQPGVNDIQKVDLNGMTALIDAAKSSGVKHFIYTSFSRTLSLDFPLSDAKRAIEKHLLESGMSYTILLPGYFMEVWLSPAVGFDAAAGQAQIYGSGDQLISWISYKDVAQFAVYSVTNAAARNAELELGGPEGVSPNQVIALYEQLQGKPWAVTYVPIEALQGQFAGAEDPMQKSFVGLMVCYALGSQIEMAELLKHFPLKLTSVQEFAQGAMVHS
jgi:uncharacterized protein YbjT (DUF2867 family)